MVATLLLAAPTVGAVMVDQVDVVSDPGVDRVYATSDTIEIAVSFDDEVHVTHNPSLVFRLRVGSQLRSMRFVDGSGTDTLRFRYRVQAGDLDTNGISFDANAMTGGTLADRDAGPVQLVLPAGLADDAGHRVDAVAPRATTVAILSDPGDDMAYAKGDHVEFDVSFDDEVVVSGAPELLVTVGPLSRVAVLLDIRPQNLTFRYVVQGGDSDANGISVQAGALRRGVIEDQAGNPADRLLPAPLTDVAGHRVDAIEPEVTGVEITSDAGPDDTYALGDTIEVSVTLDEVVHVTTPCANAEFPELVLVLSVGRQSRAAGFAGGSGTQTLRFDYVVQGQDSDDDGISISISALSGGCIRDSAGNLLVARAIPPVPAQPAHKVDAGGSRGPNVTRVAIVSSPRQGDTYGTSETISVQVVFDEKVHVTGEPVLTVSVGARSRDAGYASGSGTERLTFRYTVQEGDLDEDGISVGPSALRQGIIEDDIGNEAVRTFPALAADPSHKVRGLGSLEATLAVVSTPQTDDTYGLDDDIEVTVTFAEVVHVTDDPVLLLSIGGQTRTATFVSGSGTRILRFRYTVQSGDVDEDGLSVGSGALQDGEITSGTGGAVTVYFQALPAQPGHKVNGLVAPRVTGVSIVSLPATADTYAGGEDIELAVRFDELVHVTGDPVLGVSVGGNTRSAELVSGSGTHTLTFRYTVQEGDVDEDGISVAANALSGGAIAGASGEPVSRVFAGLPAQSGHKVDAASPTPTGVRIVSDPGQDMVYGAGDAIDIEITFDEVVHVIGLPVLTLSVGGEPRQAPLESGSGTPTLTFRYVVQRNDIDEDGVSMAANALSGGVIADASGNVVAVAFDGLPAQSGHKVDGTLNVTAVSDVAIVSTPTQDRTYGVGDSIEVAVTFDAVVHVTGTPVLAVLVGGAEKAAGLVSGSGTVTLTFRYTVQEGDFDDDGVSVAPNALTGGAIQDDLGNAVAREFAALPADATHLVDAVGPAVSEVRLASSPLRNDTYGAGEAVEAAVTFDEVVHVTGAPVLTLSVGGRSRQAALVSGSGTATLTFRYTVQEGDFDDDGISIGPNALTGGAIQDDLGNAVAREFAALPADATHLVDAVGPAVSEVRLVSSPLRNDTYEAGEAVEAAITFDEVVHVIGTPVLTLSVGSRSRQAAFVSGSGTESLLFRYSVIEDDLDNDGVSIAANALIGGVIEDDHGNAVDRTFTALPAAAGHKVDGTVSTPRVVDVRITSLPEAAGMYVEGEAIEVTVAFDRAVHVTGDPVLTLSVGGRSRPAALVSGSGTPALVFSYVVQAGDTDEDGVSLAANALAGGVIDDGDGRAANLSFAAIDAQQGHRVGSEIVADLQGLTLSVGETWTEDLAEVLTQVGAANYGTLHASSQSPGVVNAHMAGSVLTVTPLAEGIGTVVVTATNIRLTLSLTVTVRASAAEKAVLADALATIGRGLLWSATNTIGTRLDMAERGVRAPAGPRYAVAEDAPEAAWSRPDTISGATDGTNAHAGPPGLQWQTTGVPTGRDVAFEMPLIGIGSAAVSWGVWGGADYWSFASEPEQGAYDGDMTSGYIGVDARGEAWVAGVAVSHAQADVSYEFAGAAHGTGILETELTTVHPYVQWSPHERARMWAILGFGTGEALAVRDGAEPGDPADLSMSMGVAGLRFDLGSPGGLDLAVRGDAGLASLETGDGLAAVEDLSVGVHQVRLGLEASWAWQLGGGTLAPFLDIGGRFDGGDGQTGGGVEIAGGLRYRSPMVGLEVKGRTLATHAAEGHSENGVSAMVVVGPSQDGSGWTLSLAPRWGGVTDVTDLLWRRDYRRGLGGGEAPRWGLTGRVGYGAALAERPGLVTPFGEFDLTARDRRRLRFGLSYRLDRTPWQPPVHLEIAGERVEIYPVETDHRVVLTGRATF